MSLSFACPECKAQMEVPDDLAGQAGQCPRCQHVFTIPSPQQALPVLVAKALPGEPTKIPPTDPWAKHEPRERDRPRRSESPRPRRPRPAPKPSGPLWPWFVGILGAFIVGSLLFSSFLVLVLWRKPVTHHVNLGIHPEPIVIDNQRITAGGLEGRLAILDNGVFQVRTELTPNDPPDPKDFRGILRSKQYDVELIAFKSYVIEQESNQILSLVRIEDGRVELQRRQAFGNMRSAQMFFTPIRTQIYTVYAGSTNPANGPFTLTIREQNRMKPVVP